MIGVIVNVKSCSRKGTYALLITCITRGLGVPEAWEFLTTGVKILQLKLSRSLSIVFNVTDIAAKDCACKITGKDLEVISPLILVEIQFALWICCSEDSGKNKFEFGSLLLDSVLDSYLAEVKFIKRLQVFVIATLTISLPDDFDNHFELLIMHPIWMNQVLDLVAKQKISKVEITLVTIGIKALKIAGRNHEIRESIAALEALVGVVPEGEDVCNLIAKIFKLEANMEQIQESPMEELV
ncbi:hypothetical protein ZIOFF_013079 [Zingiber officinale]|uniref:Uncharacterized protein n=1 Tax=Zingiber officinale TaxID=94328 RepID=A0A8J5H8R2_ZINOF|nr:hypothetical protein ZIOFF_013079 [Zingiber officinale]